MRELLFGRILISFEFNKGSPPSNKTVLSTLLFCISNLLLFIIYIIYIVKINMEFG